MPPPAGARHDPLVALRLIYVMLPRSWAGWYCAPDPTPQRRSRSWSYATSSPCFDGARCGANELDRPGDDLRPQPTTTHASTRWAARHPVDDPALAPTAGRPPLDNHAYPAGSPSHPRRSPRTGRAPGHTTRPGATAESTASWPVDTQSVGRSSSAARGSGQTSIPLASRMMSSVRVRSFRPM